MLLNPAKYVCVRVCVCGCERKAPLTALPSVTYVRVPCLIQLVARQHVWHYLLSILLLMPCFIRLGEEHCWCSGLTLSLQMRDVTSCSLIASSYTSTSDE